MIPTPLAEWAAAHARTVGRTGRTGDQPAAPAVVMPGQLEFRETRAFEGHEMRVWMVGVRTTSDGRQVLATGSADRTARIWDVDTGECTGRLPGHDGAVVTVAWVPERGDGDALLATVNAATVTLWDGSCRRLHTINAGEDINAFAWIRRSGGLQLVTAAHDRSVRVWSVDGTELRRLALARSAGALDWVGDPGGARLAIGDLDGGLRIWDADTAADPHRLDGHAVGIFGLAADAASSGRRRFATGAADGSVRIWDADTGQCTRELRGHTEKVWAMAWTDASAGRSLLATASADRTVRVWNPDAGECVAVLNHPDEVNSVAFAPGGDLRLVTGCDDSLARLWTAEHRPAIRPAPRRSGSAPLSFRRRHVLSGHESHVFRVAVAATPDGGPMLASASSTTVRVWDADAGSLRQTLTGHTEDVVDVVWALDRQGRLEVTSVGSDGELITWEPTSARSIASQGVGPKWGIARIRHWDGRELLAGSGVGTAAQVWDLGTRESVRTFRDPTIPGDDYVAAVAFTVDAGELLLACGHTQGSLRVWAVDSGDLVSTLDGHSGFVTSVAWTHSADGSPLLATASNDGTIRLWNGRTGELRRTLPGRGEPVFGLSCAELPGGPTLLATSDETRTVEVWDVDSGTAVASVEHPAVVVDVALWAPRAGKLEMATAGADGNAYVWEAPVPRGEQPPPQGLAFVLDRAFASRGAGIVRGAALVAAPDGRVLLASSRENRVWIEDVGADECLHTLEGHDNRIFQTAWTVHGARLLLATAGKEGHARIWDGRTGECLHRLTAHTQNLWGAAWTVHPDGRPLLATGCDDGAARVWDGRTGECVTTVGGGGSDVNSVAWGTSRAGRPLLVLGRWNGAIEIFDLDARRERRVADHGTRVWSVAWGRLRDGRGFIASTSYDDGTIRIWDAETGTCLHTMDAHERQAYDVATVRLPDGRWLLGTASADNTVRVWDPETGECLQVLEHPHEVNRLSFLVAGGRLLVATGCDDGVARVWAADLPQSWLQADPVEQVVIRDRRPVAVAEAVLLGSRGAWQPLGLTSDLVTVTGPDGATGLFDPRLRVLADHPGVVRLRTLGWPADARAAFAAMLSAAQPVQERFQPPPGSGPDDQQTVLAAVAESAQGPAEAAVLDVEPLVRAADGVTAATVTLLKVLGPRAAAADPLLAVRLRHRLPELPDLTSTQSELLASVSDPAHRHVRVSGGSTVRAAGTAGVTRRGSPTSLLLTQLALDDDVFEARYAANELLYRHHPAGSRPRIEPVTIVLDTTPPTFGPAEGVLRLVAHMVVLALWEHGSPVSLVTLTDPDRMSEPAQPADLLEVWTSRTLDPPDLATAWRTAATRSSNPTVTLTVHHHAPADPGPRRRLVTTHQPGRPPRHPASGPHHHHLPPEPSPGELASVLTAVLSSEGGDR